ncbi:unnamed protein product [Orchesella dallaii]|uniref:Uncharacterized protein n=1 Tax=Orchesella dallaii TaxID=48710 RepID=A0ABP1RDP3_9HEXA
MKITSVKHSIYIFCCVVLETSLVQTLSTSESSCISQLFPDLNNHWENYILYFFNPKIRPQRGNVIFPGKLEPHSSLRPRSVSIRNTHKLERGYFRFSNPTNVIITPVVYPNAWELLDGTLVSFAEILVPSRSLFIYIWADLHKGILSGTLKLAHWADFMTILPALKVIVTIPQTLRCDPSLTTATIVCSGYCKPSRTPVNEIGHLLTHSKLQLTHGSIFRNAQGKSIIALVLDTFGFTKGDRELLQGTCLSASRRMHSSCTSEFMSIITFSLKHNLTVFLYHTTPRTIYVLRIEDPHSGPEVIQSHTPWIIDHSRSMNHIMHIVSSLAFDAFETPILNYCKRRVLDTPSFEFLVWYQPFPSNIWICTLIVIIYGLVFSFRHRIIRVGFMEFLKHLASVLGHGPYVQNRYCVVIMAIWFIMCQLYGNGFTSVITVAFQPAGYTKVKELFENGYKILHIGNSEGATFLGFLKRNKLMHFNETALELVPDGSVTIFDLLKMIGRKGAKLVFKDTLAQKFYNRPIARKFLNEHFNESFDYFTLEESIDEKQCSWTLKTEIREGIKETLEKIRSAGLYYRWDEWASWHKVLTEKALHKTEYGKSDVKCMEVLPDG